MQDKKSKPLEANKAAGSSEIISAMNKQFEQLNDKFTNLADEFSSFKSEILALVSAKSSEIECLKKEMTMLRKHVTKLEGSIDDQNAYDRRDCVILSGELVPLVTQGEVCTNIVMDLVKEKLNLQLAASDISTVHRLGKKPHVQGPDRRSIIVKLCRRSLKHDLMFATKNQSSELPRLYINESLTPARSTILYALRQIKKSHPNLVSGCSSYEGRIYAYTKDPLASSDNGKKPTSPSQHSRNVG